MIGYILVSVRDTDCIQLMAELSITYWNNTIWMIRKELLYYIVYEQRQMSIYAQNRGKHFMYFLAPWLVCTELRDKEADCTCV